MRLCKFTIISSLPCLHTFCMPSPHVFTFVMFFKYFLTWVKFPSQALYRFSVLQATESLAGPGNEAKTSKQAESSSCILKIEHTFAQVRSSTIYDLTMQCYPHSQQHVNVPSLPGKMYPHSPSRREKLFLIVEEARMAF